MSHPFDAAAKDFPDVDPAVWPAFLGRPCKPGTVRVDDSDLSTVSTATDKVILIDDPDDPWGLLMEFQASHDPDFPTAVLQRYGIARHRHRRPFSVAVIFLRREANMPIFKEKGLAETNPVHPGTSWHFPCQVIRLWELPVADFLKGPLALLPYAPLTDVDQAEVPKVLNTVFERYRAEATGERREKLISATFILMGLRYNAEWIDSLFMGAIGMEESSTYQLLLRRGDERGERRTTREFIRRLAGKRLGPIPPELDARLEILTDLDQLRRMADLILSAASWEELFAVSPSHSE